MGVNYHYIRIKVKGFQTKDGQYRPEIQAGTLGDVADCPEKCDRCANLKKVKKMMKRSIFECHHLYEILEKRNQIAERMGMEEAMEYHYVQLAEMESKRSDFRKSLKL